MFIKSLARNFSFAFVVLIIVPLVVFLSLRSVAGPQQDVILADADNATIEVAEIRLSIIQQHIVIAKLELELLEPALRVAEQKVAVAEANLVAATVQTDSTNRLVEQKVVSESEKTIQNAKRNAVAAELAIAKAESFAVPKSIQLKQANIALLELQLKSANVELQQLRNRASRVK